MKWLLVLFGLALPAQGLAIPIQVPYSGQLAEGGELVNGTVSLTVRLFATETGGTELYSETFPSVAVNRGVYHLLLNIPPDRWDGSDRWLGVTVNSGSELAPRVKISSVPYAIRAAVADSAAGGLAVEAFTASLVNASDFTGPNGTSPVNLRYTNVAQNSNAAVFSPQADGTLRILKAGVISATANFNAIVAAGSGYAQITSLINGTPIAFALGHSASGSFFTQVSTTLHWKVNAGDNLNFRALPSQISNMDNAPWSTLTVQWIGRP